MLVSSCCSSTTVVAQTSCDSAAASPCAASSESTSLRNPASSAHTASRNAVRSPGARSKASPTISLTFGQFFGATAASLHLTHQPYLCHIPFALHCRSRHTQDLSNLFGSQPAEESEFD